VSAAGQHNLREVFEEFWRALDDAEECLLTVHSIAYGATWWNDRNRRPQYRADLEEESEKLLDARKRLHALAPKVAAHVIAPPGQTGEQWVLEALALGDEAWRLAKDEYEWGPIRYRGPMNPALVEERPEVWRDALRQVEEDYQRVRCGLSEAGQYVQRVMALVLPPTADTEEPTSTAKAVFPCSAKQPRLVVTLNPPQVTLDGRAHAVKPDGSLFVDALLKADGDWVTGETLGIRADRVKKDLPKEIRSMIESSPGKGSRISRNALG